VIGKPTTETEKERRKSKSLQKGRKVQSREVNNSPGTFRKQQLVDISKI